MELSWFKTKLTKQNRTPTRIFLGLVFRAWNRLQIALSCFHCQVDASSLNRQGHAGSQVGTSARYIKISALRL